MCLSRAVACSLWLFAPSVCTRVDLEAETYPGLESSLAHPGIGVNGGEG